MARFISNRSCKRMRRVGKDLYLKGRGIVRDVATKCKINVRPGVHGAKKTKGSNFSEQLTAKKMLQYIYGVLEKQFRRYYQEASRRKGPTGENLLEILESRLDNVVYRMGFASTRAEARQLVRHKAIMVYSANETPEQATNVNIPSYMVKPDDVIFVREKSKTQARIQDALQVCERIGFAEWVTVDVAKMSGTFKRYPDRSELPSEINEQLVVELYSK